MYVHCTYVYAVLFFFFLAINISIAREIKRYDQNYDFILLL